MIFLVFHIGHIYIHSRILDGIIGIRVQGITESYAKRGIDRWYYKSL